MYAPTTHQPSSKFIEIETTHSTFRDRTPVDQQKMSIPNQPSTSNDYVPLDPDLFNPDIVGEANSFPGPDENFYPSEELIWDDIDQNDLDYETEEEFSGEEEQLGFKGSFRSKKIGTATNKRSIRELAGSSGDDGEDGQDDEESGGEDEDSDQESDPGDLRRLIGAIHGQEGNQGNSSHGILGKEWDRSMDQELNELKEAEEAMRPGKRKRFKLRGEPELSVEVSVLLGKANLAFIEKKYDEAIPVFEEIVRIEPMCRMAWNNLGAIYQDMGDFERSSQFRIIGAHLTPKSADIWKELASESRQHGLLSQAIYCYSEAIKGTKNDVESMWDRSYLLFEVGRSRQALAGYLAILKISPHNPDVLREVAHLCATTDEKELPIRLFQDALKHYQSMIITPPAEWLTDGFGLEHIQILVRLMIESRSSSVRTAQPTDHSGPEDQEQLHQHYYDTLKLIKQATRWLQGRLDPTRPDFLDWDLLEDDREYDPLRKNREAWEYLPDPRYEESPTYPLTNELRTYLGICRLYIGDEDEAALHFDMIKSLGIEENAELCMSIGDAYCECAQWDEALDFYHELAENDSTNNAKLWHKIGRCYRHLGNLEGALECFEAVAETDSLDLLAKTQLAELYEQLGFRQKALDMVNDLIELRRKARETGVSIENELTSTNGNPSRANTLASRTAASRSLAERRIDEELLTQKYVKTYDKLETISSKLATDPASDGLSLMTEYVRLATPLVEGFRETPALFPCVLSAKFGGLNTTAPRSGKRDETTAKSSANPEETVHPETAQEFRGIRFANWVRIFVYYAFSCAKMDQVDEACEVLGHVMRAPTFRQSAPMQQVLRLAYAASCLAKGDFIETVDTIRWLSARMPYHNDLVRLINALLSRGFEQSVAFFNTNTQKWLLRQIQIIDGYIGKPHSRPGYRNLNDDDDGDDVMDQDAESTAVQASQLTRQERAHPNEAMMKKQMMKDDEGEEENDSYWKPSKFKPTKLSPVFLITFAQILAGTRSFKSAIVYYLRIRESYPDEPLINLLLAITYVQRAMQRQTDNRHHQIVQGLAFFEHYRAVRHKEFGQEVEFNLGRIYHGLGLSSLAITHYNRVLALAPLLHQSSPSSQDPQSSSEPPTDLSNLAAYNLVLIYSTSGSPDLAHRLTCQYLTV
ncbi:transcription factor TFIIIC subunit tfc4 [Puccinia graminis f. sp. tritici]|uniref:Transcription factor TFIIIC subunit tfc4 n=1 Tax=Puccinia graminis f. sp. tritici TaxID=56615 RepID=A0A5B0M7V9_PUCGR|nr:transcription factor TFIIIC subunit tfc4 [Puccinia graminis f. sp. tritici]